MRRANVEPYVKRLDSPPQRERWVRKVRRLREIALGLEPSAIIRDTVDEGATNLLLVNLNIKAQSMAQLLRGTDWALVNNDGTVPQPRFKDWVADAETEIVRAIMNKIVCGLGAILLVGSHEDGWRAESVPPERLYWDSEESDLLAPKWVIREIRMEKSVVYEYWDTEKTARFTRQELLTEQPNPFGEIPLAFLVGYVVADMPYPVGDIEIAYPQQLILNEVRRTLLDMARRGSGFFSVKQTSIDEAELARLTDPGEVFVLVKEQDAIQPIPTPAPAQEWTALEALARNDLDALMGLSEYLRGVLPTGRAKFASEVLAAVSGQQARIALEWLAVRRAVEKYLRTRYRVEFPNAPYPQIRAIEDTTAISTVESGREIMDGTARQLGLPELPERIATNL